MTIYNVPKMCVDMNIFLTENIIELADSVNAK